MKPSRPEDPLLRTMTETLDRQAALPDPELERLVDGVLRTKRAPAAFAAGRWAFVGLALAAGVTAFLWLPVALTPAAQAPVAVTAAQPPTVDPAFLDDMEMLSALGEEPDET